MAQSDALNCELTETNTTHLDEYNPRHVLLNSDTDVYQLYYKNDGSLYCDNLNDAGNKKLVMFIKSDTAKTTKDKMTFQTQTSNEYHNTYATDSLTRPQHDAGIYKGGY